VVHVDKEIDESTLNSIFSNVDLTGGGEITKVGLNRSYQMPIAFIYYKNKSDKERVLMKRKYNIYGYEFTVNPYKTTRDSSASRTTRDSSAPNPLRMPQDNHENKK